MRQGDGSDLPGVSGPRGADIGIIYVAPNDERQSVLAAILTQDKLGRKQVVVVLPEQNKAFQRAVDFDGLKGLRRGLKTQLIFIAPGGPGPAEFARQRGFPVYSSLENYAESLRDADQAKGVAKRGWLSLLWRKPASSTAAPSTDPIKPGQSSPNTAAASTGQNSTKTDDRHVPGETTAAIAGAAGAAAIMGMDALAARGSNPSAPPAYEDDWDTLPAADSSLSDTAPTQANTGLHSASTISAEGDAEPKIIQLSQSRGRITDKLPLPAIVPVPAAQPNVPTVNSPARQRNTGKMAAIGAVGAASIAAGAATTGRAARVGRVLPPRGSVAGGGSSPVSTRLGPRGRWWAALALLLLTLFIGTGIALAIPGIRDRLPNIVPGIAPTATVTITPASADVKNIYGGIFGVKGTPDPTQRQVQARLLSFTTSPQSKTVNATGIMQTTGVQATGTITFYNGATIDQQVNGGTTFNLANGIHIVTDRNIDIPPAHPPTSFGVASVSAHAAAVGTSGNIAAGTISGACCSTDGSITAKNLNPFAGGQDPQNFTFVQQSDIDGAAKPLEAALIPNAQKSLQAQVHPNERFVDSTQCVPNVTSDHAAGDKATNVMVMVKVTCSGEVYDAQAAQTIAADLLKKQAVKDPGSGYALVGNLVTTITQVTVKDKNKGTLLLMVKAEGIWVFQFNDTQRQALARLIAGKSKKDAQAILMQQTGVAKVAIQLNGGDGNTLPTNLSAITIVVQSIPGLQGTTTPTTGPGSPTVPAVTSTVGKG